MRISLSIKNCALKGQGFISRYWSDFKRNIMTNKRSKFLKPNYKGDSIINIYPMHLVD